MSFKFKNVRFTHSKLASEQKYHMRFEDVKKLDISI